MKSKQVLKILIRSNVYTVNYGSAAIYYPKIVPGHRDTWKFFRETCDNSGTLQKKIGTSKKRILKIREDDPNFRDDLRRGHTRIVSEILGSLKRD